MGTSGDGEQPVCGGCQMMLIDNFERDVVDLCTTSEEDSICEVINLCTTTEEEEEDEEYIVGESNVVRSWNVLL